ncbi:MAG: hypothetical protein RLZZ623_2443 [Actinomycetota bacterium]
MPEQRFSIIEAIEHQAAGCARVGSALYASLLTGLAADYLSGGTTAELLEGVSEQPLHDAIALRYLAVAHRLALAGDAPELAQHYPSCGGTWSGADITDAFLSVVAKHRRTFVDGMRNNVQTNEVGRSVALTAGFSLVMSRHGLPLRTLEIGGSAGLLSRWPSYSYDTGETTAGDASSEVHFGPSWYQGNLPALHGSIPVSSRASSDISPIDVSKPDGRLAMLSFLWPDQNDRRDRLLAAMHVAERDPIVVERADAAEWLQRQLGGPPPEGVATVVFHSIVWQYLPRLTKDGVRAAILDAGERATTTSPLCWLRMEPATSEHADLRLSSWPGLADEVLAHVGYHGAELRWLS